VDEIKMAITRYNNSVNIDPRDRMFKPLSRYRLVNAEYTRELTHDLDYRTAYAYDSSIHYRAPHEQIVFELKFYKEDLYKLMDDLEKIEHEEHIRKQYPAAQKAWEQYQLVLELMK
jgi:hypothetical protein